MLSWIEPMLYTDPQLQPPRFFCLVCGQRCHGGRLCLHCERRAP